jgi:uncharacterized OB-fold protein
MTFMEIGTTLKPQPIIDDDNREFWTGCERGELILQRCEGCGAFRYFPGAVCPACSSLEFHWEAVSGRGTVYTYTVVHRAPSPIFAADVPYVYAVVELEEGVMMPTNIVDVDPEQVRIDMPVRVRFRETNPGVHIPVFAPES